MPTDNRATAERLARETWTLSGFMSLWSDLSAATRQNHIACVFAGMAHRDRTAEREAARKAWDAARDMWIARDTHIEFKGLAELKRKEFDEARDRYLAAEFDAGERVEKPKITPVLTWHDDGHRKQVLADETGRIVGSVHGESAYYGDGHIGRYVTPQQARDAVKRLAEQRGAER